MFAITDEFSMVYDVASAIENLSRGYTLRDYKLYYVPPGASCDLGERLDKGMLLEHSDPVIVKQILGLEKLLDLLNSRRQEAEGLGLDNVVTAYDEAITQCELKLQSLCSS